MIFQYLSVGVKKDKNLFIRGAGKVAICLYRGEGGMESCQLVCPRGDLKHIPYVQGKAECMSQGPP